MSSTDNSSPKTLNEVEARDKNRDEYNQTADAYDAWQSGNMLMQNVCYYSTFNELKKDGIEGKTFLEVGCGPCPIGRQLANQGAKKIYGLDISSEMIENAKKSLTALGIIDKFELVCADIFDKEFALPEKVDCVVLSYTVSTFINKFEMLQEIIQQVKNQLKPDGQIFITEFSYVDQPCENFFYGMYTKKVVEGQEPKPFEPFHFIIDREPDSPYTIFNIPAHVMMHAGMANGFSKIEYML